MLNILHTIIINPLLLLFETIFQYVFSHTRSAGLSIIVLSFTLNIILLPIYKKIETIQNEETAIQKKLKPGIDKITKAYKGNEQYMVLQTYYSQNNYKPIYALRSSISLLLEIPFFIAAYSFLSELSCLSGRGFLFIEDFSEPDGLLFGLNVMPIIMFFINIISCTVYTKGQPFKQKIQLYLMAIVFLAILYNSPSGLAFYYLLNNLFSLIRNVITKFDNKIPKKEKSVSKEDKKIFICSCIFLCLLTGLLIPTQVISASPEEFISKTNYLNPLHYVANTMLLSVGVFIWINIYYELMNCKIKKSMSIVMLSFSISAIFNHFFFKQGLGDISPMLVYENSPLFSNLELIINSILMVIILLVIVLIYKNNIKVLKTIISLLCVSMVFVISVNSVKINSSYQDAYMRRKNGTENASITLSKNKQNVVVIMLDRAISRYFPYLLKEKPCLYEQFAGFTYYPNTISFGHNTNVGSPALFGGYEYIPEEMNKRDKELLVDKHNEALKVMPVLFDNNNFDVTVFDPPLAGYKEIPDISIFDNYEDIKAYNTEGSENDSSLDKLNRNLFCFSVLRVAPTFAFSFLYDSGDYSGMLDIDYKNNSLFMEKYSILCNLPNYTKIVDSKDGAFMMFQNSTTHEPIELQLPDYVFTNEVNNSDYNEENTYKQSIFDEELILENEKQIMHYHTNMAAFIQIGEWLDYLRENDVYDNTRIIIASDHGMYLFLDSDMILDKQDMLMYNSLLLVKDFNSNIFDVDNSFMTNADVPYLATRDIIQNPTNPFTFNKIEEVNKKNRVFNVLDSYYNLKENNGYRFAKGNWVSIHDNCFDINNWKRIEGPSE